MLPIFLALFGVYSYLDEIEIVSRDKAINLQEQILIQLRKKEDTPEYFRFLFEQVFEFIEKDRPKRLEYALNDMRRCFPGLFKIYVVDSHGNLNKKLSEANSSEYILKKLYKSLVHPTNDLIEINRTLLLSFIGKGVVLDILWKNGYKTRITEVSNSGEKHWFCSRTTIEGGLFVHIKETPDWADLAIKDKIRTYLKIKGTQFIQVGKYSPGDTLPSAPVSDALMKFQGTSNQSFQYDNSLIYVTRLKSGSLLWISFIRNSFEVSRYPRYIATFLAIALFIFLARISAKIHFGGAKLFFSIKWRLVCLFFYASLLPLLIMFSVVWKYLAKEYDFQMTQNFETAEKTLRNIDLSFPLLRLSLEKKVYKNINNLLYSNESELIQTNLHLKKLAKKLSIDRLFLFDKNGHPQISCSGTYEDKPVEKGSARLIGELSRAIICHLNQEDASISDNLNIEMLNAIGGINFMSMITRRLGKLDEIKIGSDVSWVMFKTIYDTNEKVTYMLVLFWEKFKLEKNYLKYCMKSPKKIPKGIKVIASEDYINTRMESKVKRASEKSFFSSSLSKKAYSFISWLEIWQTTIKRKIYDHGRAYFFTGIKPKEIKAFYLLALQDDFQIREKLARLKKLLLIFAFLCIIISTFIGTLLSQKLINPIESLGTGVKLIENKQFRFQIPIIESDELGKLTEMFNQMVENLEELNIAVKVQNQLFPKAVLKIGEYSVFGRSRSASQLGGDYFDYFSFKDRYLLAVIGDVTGHGIPAALVMAMAKAIVHERVHTGDNLYDIIQILNATIFRNLNKEMLMTVGFILIDSITHETLYINCGHPYPFCRKTDGSIRMVENSGGILGLRENVQIRGKTIILEKGDKLIFYTDGMVESLSEKPNLSNYDIFQEYLFSRPILNAELACDDYIENHPHILTGRALPDDLTVLQIERG
ncbi:MAG: SpoIIE family protein phosphatase [Candidatus Riflebacteria bacterium]|nr:SpoIIE family protein phosphatase [Candidatus Riflebacteria bacterium]